jgi:hypothetical protein
MRVLEHVLHMHQRHDVSPQEWLIVMQFLAQPFAIAKTLFR